MAILFWFLVLLGHGALWVEIVNRLHGIGWQRRLIDAVTMACGAAVTAIPLLALVLMARGNSPAWLVAYAWFSLLVLIVFLAGRLGRRWDPARDRHTELTDTTTLDLQQALGLQATGSPRIATLARLPGNEVLQIKFEERTIRLERLPPALDGLKIAHLTDLHMSGRLSVGYFQALVEQVNAWSPDLACLTGDLVEQTPQLDWIEPTLGQFRAKLGTYFILGNHDAKIDVARLLERLEGNGLIDASRQLVQLDIIAQPCTLLGDQRPWFPCPLELVGNESFTICLAHTPDRFEWAQQQGIDLVLAGHCHGGQVCVPGLGPLLCPSRHGVRYASGTFRRGRTVMHVGRGSGSLFPLRYFCPPEVALITLRSL